MRSFGTKMLAADSDGSCLARLVAQLQVGDPTALGQLYDATAGRVYALAHRIAGNRADAEEVTCDVYRHVWHNAKQFDSSRGSPLPWIMVIARNCAIDCCRRRRGPREGSSWAQFEQQRLAANSPTAEDLLYQFQLGTRVRAALASLNATQATLISLAFFDGLSHGEIASVTQLPLGTVKSHVRRALTALRRTLVGMDQRDTSREAPSDIPPVSAASSPSSNIS